MIRRNRRIEVSAWADVCGKSAVDSVCLVGKNLMVPGFKPPSIFGVQISFETSAQTVPGSGFHVLTPMGLSLPCHVVIHPGSRQSLLERPQCRLEA